MNIVLLVLALVLVLATLLPFFRLDAWWIRVFDFPRSQIAVAGVLVALPFAAVWDRGSRLEGVVLAALLLAVAYQSYRMFPYTRLAAQQVQAKREAPPDACITLLISNVLMDNRAADRFLALVRTHEPDVVLAVETDDWWEQALRGLEEEYPHTVKEPLGNTYGMLLYSRLELINPEVRYLVEDDIPSFHMQVRLRNGRLVRLHSVHPKPPYPKEDVDTTERDAELLLVGRAVKEQGGPAIVAGDLNDVAWSHTTHLFQRISGLLDPRLGRGFYNTFDARNPVLRWPLDHVFHSDHFKLVSLRRLPAWGSDHFPMLACLCYDPVAAREQEAPPADAADREEAEEKIEKAGPQDDL